MKKVCIVYILMACFLGSHSLQAQSNFFSPCDESLLVDVKIADFIEQYFEYSVPYECSPAVNNILMRAKRLRKDDAGQLYDEQISTIGQSILDSIYVGQIKRYYILSSAEQEKINNCEITVPNPTNLKWDEVAVLVLDTEEKQILLDDTHEDLAKSGMSTSVQSLVCKRIITKH